MKNVITKLANLFPHADKVLHFIAGALISLLVLFIMKEPWYGFSAALLAGLYKEFIDHNKQDSISKKYAINSYLDLAATILGGLFTEFLW